MVSGAKSQLIERLLNGANEGGTGTVMACGAIWNLTSAFENKAAN